MTALYGFAYGESLEGTPPRSLGYRLLTPSEPEPWRGEVESLARLLQAAPYPEHWPPAELFCSVLLSDGVIGLRRPEPVDAPYYSRMRNDLSLVSAVMGFRLGVSAQLCPLLSVFDGRADHRHDHDKRCDDREEGLSGQGAQHCRPPKP